MNENTSRKLDLLVGVPLCWLLTCWRRLCGWFRREPRDVRPRKILFIKLAEMGAIVLTMPAFEAARRRVGRENLYCLILSGNRDVHDLIDVFSVENLLTIRERNLWTFARDVLAFRRACRRQGIDSVIDLEGFSRISAILAYFSGAAIRVGFDRYTTEGLYRGDLLTHRISYNYYNHASVQFLTMVEALDADPEEVPLLKRRVELGDYRLPLFRPRPEELETIRQLLRQRCGELGAPIVVLNPNLIDLLPLRRWPRERFLELGRRIIDDCPEATILLTGLPAERELSRQLAAEIHPQRAISLAGETRSLRELATLLTMVDLLITSDCGPGHMAALTDVTILSIFGPETPQLYSPLSPHNHSLWAHLACSPCLHAYNHRRSPCKNNVCMQTVTVEQVYEVACGVCPALASAASRSE